jgi:hypothetical protein
MQLSNQKYITAGTTLKPRINTSRHHYINYITTIRHGIAAPSQESITALAAATTLTTTRAQSIRSASPHPPPTTPHLPTPPHQPKPQQPAHCKNANERTRHVNLHAGSKDASTR